MIVESNETAGPPQCESCGRPTPAPGAHPLALIRYRLGWSYQKTARQIARRSAHLGLGNMAAERQKVWRWEHRGVTPDQVTQAALASLLGVNIEVVEREGWPGWLRTVPGAAERGGRAVRS